MRSIHVDGIPLALVGAWGDLTVQSRWGDEGCGTWEIGWSMDLPVGYRHPLLTRGRLVQVIDAGVVVESGVLAEPDRDEGRFTATGLVREAERYKALNGSLDSTTNARVAVDRAIDRGLPWRRDVAIKDAKYGGELNPGGLNDLHVLLDAVADEAGVRWGVHPDGRMLWQADATDPMLFVGPGVVELGTSDDEYASAVVVRYYDSAAAEFASVRVEDEAASAAWGVAEWGVDASDLGGITTAEATTIAENVLAKGRARLRPVGSFEVALGEVVDASHTTVPPHTLRAGQVLRVPLPAEDPRNLTGRLTLDVVLGQVTYTDGTDTASLTPLGAADRSMAAVIERALTRANRRRLNSREDPR